MVSGEFGPTYAEVRNLNNLSSTEISDSVLDQHLEEAFEEVQSALKTKFSTSTINFTAVTLNTGDLSIGGNGSSLYFSNFYDPDNNIVLPLLTVSAITHKWSEDAEFQTLTEGWEKDYRILTRENKILFNRGFLHGISTRGYQNLKITGTAGHVYSAMTDMEQKFKKYIALIAAMKGITYSAGSSYNDSKSRTVGNISTSETEFSSTQQNTFNDLKKQLDSHIARHGLAGKQTISRITG